MGGGSGGTCACLVLVVLIASLVVVGGGRIFAVELLVVSVALPFRVLVDVGGGGVLVAVELVFGVVLVVDAVSVEGEQLAKFGGRETEGLTQPGVCFAELVELLKSSCESGAHGFELGLCDERALGGGFNFFLICQSFCKRLHC